MNGLWRTLFCLALPFALVGLYALMPDRGVRV